MRQTEVGRRGIIINIISIFQEKKLREIRLRSSAAELSICSPKPKAWNFSITPQRLSTVFLAGWLPGCLCTEQQCARSEMAYICYLSFLFLFFLTTHCVTQSALKKKKKKTPKKTKTVLFDKSTKHPGSIVDAALFQCIINGK